MKQVNWRWYGTWIFDWLTCNRNDFTDNAWASFDIWKRAYLNEFPELECLSDFDLIDDHYMPAMAPFFESWIFQVWLVLNSPMSIAFSCRYSLCEKLKNLRDSLT